jgi:diguanylate cyclase (GGDEF)-like protein
MDSLTGIIVQFAGIFLIALLSVFLRRSLRSVTLDYWAMAWGSQSVALLSLLCAHTFQSYTPAFYFCYFFGEYAFCFFLIAGCRNFALNLLVTKKFALWLFCGVIVAGALSVTGQDSGKFFFLHALALSVLFSSALYTLRYVKRARKKSFGLQVFRAGLLLLTLDFLHYFFIVSLRNTPYALPATESYMTYGSLINLVIEVLLGFGMIIVLLEKVIQEGEKTNRKLQDAHFQLEQLAQTDPLTTAFNRHAFYNFVQKQHDEKSIRGCVCVLDIDGLKPINDIYGHSIGDLAIRSVATEIRALIRADDLLFRWGGDEFFVIMIGMNLELADLRFATLDASLMNLKFHGLEEKISVGVSYGIAEFNHASELEDAIAEADAEMYKQKTEHKKLEDPASPLYGGNFIRVVSDIHASN